MKISCNVIRDILPLYAEEMASADTRKMVDEHISTCESCRKQMDEMTISNYNPIDIDTAPLRKLKSNLRKKKILTILFSAMLTMVVAVVVIAYLTAPEYLPYSESVVSITENDDGTVLASFGDGVSGYEISHHLAEEGSGYVYNITVWDTIWNRIFSKSHMDNTVLNPDDESVAAVYYYMTDGSGDILIHGQNPGGFRVTLPRLVLGYYAFFAAGLAIICGVALSIFNHNEKLRNIITKILLLPISYLLGHLFIAGFDSTTYSASRDFLAILLVTIPLYIVFLSAHSLIKDYKMKKMNQNI